MQIQWLGGIITQRAWKARLLSVESEKEMPLEMTCQIALRYLIRHFALYYANMVCALTFPIYIYLLLTICLLSCTYILYNTSLFPALLFCQPEERLSILTPFPGKHYPSISHGLKFTFLLQVFFFSSINCLNFFLTSDYILPLICILFTINQSLISGTFCYIMKCEWRNLEMKTEMTYEKKKDLCKKMHLIHSQQFKFSNKFL